MNDLDKVISDITSEPVPASQLDAAAARVRQHLFPETGQLPAAASDSHLRIRNCADFQALIPAYLDRTLSAGRALLLQDHTRECVACRHAVTNARAGVAPTLIRPKTPPTRTISKVWAMAAMATVAFGFTATYVARTFMTGSTGPIAVQNVSGILYAVSDTGSQPIFAGHQISPGQRVRTAKDSTAVVRLGDGSLVEMNSRAELAVLPQASGTHIRLDRGDIIVQAAVQRKGTLDILTPDCTVSVKGTIFAVNRGMKGTRVSVVQGAVKVAQGTQAQMLKPGDQVTTDNSLTRTPVKDEVAWSRDSERYFALLSTFNAIKEGIDRMPSPGLRYQSKLLSYVSSDTVFYAAIPNVSSTLAEAQRLFNDRLQQSEVLRTWWNEQQDGPKLQQMVDTLRRFSEYLGDEIVFTVNSNGNGEYSEPLIMAEVKLPGLEGFLESELRNFSHQGANGLPQIVHMTAATDTAQTNNPRFWRNRRREASSHGPMLIGLKDGLMVVGWNNAQLNEVAQRTTDPSVPSSLLTSNVQSAYHNGAGWLMCVNMEQIARSVVGNERGKNRKGPKLPDGIDAMRDLIVERKDIGGRIENQATLTFEGKRWGMAAWLADPAPLGSLDFVSPNATFAVSMALRNPSWMLGDLFRMLAKEDPKFEEELSSFNHQTGISLSPSLAEPLGGEFTFAVDGPILPLPSWKFAVEVYDPNRLQWAIDQFVNAFNNQNNCTDCGKVNLAKEDVSGRTYYTLTSDKLSYEIDYVYVDGYLVAAPSRTLLNKAIQNRQTGYVLSRSENFRTQLPKDGRLNFSALIYHNVGSALTPLVNQIDALSPEAKAIAANAKPGLIYIYGEPERITVATGGSFFGLDLNAFALPALIKRQLPHPNGQPTGALRPEGPGPGLEGHSARKKLEKQLVQKQWVN